MAGKEFLEKNCQITLRISWGVKNFAEMALSRTVSEINIFLCFVQKLKMAAKNGGKTTLEKIDR